ncbi:undecaprenyl-phosphate glucose phosphotransferase [Pontibacterium sp. N1Y112]|uniref:Undecaprenyl-phosphate glucose phosphotransferase n=1 Tax=Pontibacterium sinense TaxID=2781979 RepID=A0A8J7FR20_9GAMM|nr:undecaprenyl-phosphate glucose phosphotransferase [Pontibacterium sinense]MBE9398412.1 undecaprenyl-phosphate glucose phosphotransferase [Pontibacterium sinense]
MDQASPSQVSDLGPRKSKRRLLRNHESLIYWGQLAVDGVLVAGSLMLLALLKTGDIDVPYRLLAVISVLLLFVIYSAQGVYRRAAGYVSGCYRLAVSWASVLMVLTLIGFLTKTGESFSRQVFIAWALLGFVLQAVAYVNIKFFSDRYRERFARVIPALVVGSGSLANHLKASLEVNRWIPDKVVGHVCLSGQEAANEAGDALVVGDLHALRELIRTRGVKRVYLALPIEQSGKIGDLHIDLLDMNVDLIWVPDIYALNLLNHSVREVAGMPLIFLNESPLTSRRRGSLLKDFMDRSVALLSIVLLSPVLLATAFAVKFSSRGPVLFKQERHGWDGKIINVWKFRSMKVHVEGTGEVTQAQREDPRITKVGKFIRRTSIDELPQLFNVLQGRMSLVGPRPHAVAHNEFYSDKINAYLARHRIKPGITGLAQISGCRGETETIDKMQKRVDYDLEYINNWSVWLDVKILIKTPLSLLSKDIY